MKLIILLSLSLSIFSTCFASDRVLTTTHEITSYLQQDQEALNFVSACTASTGSICKVSAISLSECANSISIVGLTFESGSFTITRKCSSN